MECQHNCLTFHWYKHEPLLSLLVMYSLIVAIHDDETKNILGTGAVCSWVSDSQMVIYVPSGADIAPGETLLLIPSVLRARGIVYRGAEKLSLCASSSLLLLFPSCSQSGISCVSDCIYTIYLSSIRSGSG